jgi:hypothetical protein
MRKKIISRTLTTLQITANPTATMIGVRGFPNCLFSLFLRLYYIRVLCDRCIEWPFPRCSDEIDSDIEEALLQQFHYAQHIPGNEDDLAVTTLTEEEANLLKNGGWSELQSVAKQSRKRRKAPAEPEVHKVQKSGDVATSAALGEASSAATVERDNSASDQEIEEESKYAITKRKDPLRNALADISQAGPAKRRRVSTGSSSGSSSDADAASSPPSYVGPNCTLCYG